MAIIVAGCRTNGQSKSNSPALAIELKAVFPLNVNVDARDLGSMVFEEYKFSDTMISFEGYIFVKESVIRTDNYLHKTDSGITETFFVDTAYRYKIFAENGKKGIMLDSANSQNIKYFNVDTLLKEKNYNIVNLDSQILVKTESRPECTLEYYITKGSNILDTMVLRFDPHIKTINFFTYSKINDKKGKGKITGISIIFANIPGLPQRKATIEFSPVKFEDTSTLKKLILKAKDKL
jgi:hypothetical protein